MVIQLLFKLIIAWLGVNAINFYLIYNYRDMNIKKNAINNGALRLTTKGLQNGHILKTFFIV